MTVRVGINGFGRIGRNFLRCALERDIKVVGINDIAPVETLAHLLAYDSTYGPLQYPVRVDGRSILVDHSPIPVTTEREPDRLDRVRWAPMSSSKRPAGSAPGMTPHAISRRARPRCSSPPRARASTSPWSWV